jgi:tyrosine-specific transport protein
MNGETKKFFRAVSILIGTIIGVGTFGIPYAFQKAGFSVGLTIFAVITCLALLIHLIYGEIVSRTTEKHRLIGYAERYLGKWGKYAGSIMVVSLTGGLLAYIIAGGEFFRAIFGSSVPLTDFGWSLLFLVAFSVFIVGGTGSSSIMEVVCNIMLFVVLAWVLVRTMPDISWSNLGLVGDKNSILALYGVSIFALSGSSSIPELRDVVGDSYSIKKVIIIGTLVSALLYVLFAFGVVGSLGSLVTKDTVTGLAEKYGSVMRIAAGIIGVMATSTSFVALGMVMRHALQYDLKLSRLVSICMVIFVPLLLFIFATHDFLKVMGFIGGVCMGLEGLLTLRIYSKAIKNGDRTPEYSLNLPSYVYVLVSVIFVSGIIFEVFNTIK